MIEQRDEELSRIYRDAEGPRPPQRVDDNILAASQRVAGLLARRPAGIGFARRWGVPAALAATVLVTSTLALMVYERQSGLDAVAPQVPRGGRTARVSPAEPRADQPRTPSPAVLQPIAPAPPISQALQSERVEQGLGGSAASSGGLGTAQPAFVPEVPRTAEAPRQREEAKPAPVAPAPAANVRAGAIPPQPHVPEAQRAFDVQPPIRPVQAPAAARAAGALRESATTPQSAEVARGLSPSAAVADAKERTPEKWLDDIRKLRIEGKMAEADRELAEFKKRYPDYRLPEDLP
jgi:resuscitation-promoting factor RpfA